MNNPPKILHLEDDATDAILIAHVLGKAGLNPVIRQADTKEEYVHALHHFNPDIILSDHSLACFNSLEALQIARELKPEVPFMMVSGMADEELAFQLIREGAVDCIWKDRLQRLPLAVLAAVRHKKTNKETAELMLCAQEQERNTIGRELHDNINQILAAAKLYLQSAMMQKDSCGDFLKKGYNYVEEAISEIRKISHQLVTPSLKEITLVGGITELIHDIRTTTSLVINFETAHYRTGLINEENKLMLYRIIQEQMNNIVKHAEAKTVTVTLSSTDRQVMLTIKDDGKGFDVMKTGRGIGLKNILSRADFLNAGVKITASPGRGCSLALCIPLHKYE